MPICPGSVGIMAAIWTPSGNLAVREGAWPWAKETKEMANAIENFEYMMGYATIPFDDSHFASNWVSVNR